MNNLLDLLQEKGIQLNADQNAIESACNTSTQVIPLIHQRVLAITGPDAKSFLQGQLTCDLDTVMERGSALGAHCNIKGHMLSLFRVLKAADDQLWLRMHHSLFDTATANLKKYMIFSKAEAKEVSNEVAGIGITGPGAQALIENLFENCPSEDNGILSLSNGIVVRVPGNRFEIWLETAALCDLLKKLPDEVSIGSTDSWLLSEIDAGIPDLRAETQEAFIPQMTNLQVFDGVSFRKGCYTGQEIVTRLQHRGQLRKPMYLAEICSDIAPQPGTKINSEVRSNMGEVVFSAPIAEGRYRLLAVITKKEADTKTLSIGDNTLTLLERPYELDPKLFEPK